jgi:ribosomal protein L15E
MNDTVRIERPLRCRRQEDLGGRAKQDSLGISVKVRTRAQDSPDDFDASVLEQTVNLEKGREI